MVTISDNGKITVPDNVQMRDFEIAQLLGIMLPTVRGVIKRLLKTRFLADCNGGVVQGNQIIPEYFGLNVVIAIAFQVQSYKADIFRKHILSKITASNLPPIYVTIGNDNRVYN